MLEELLTQVDKSYAVRLTLRLLNYNYIHHVNLKTVTRNMLSQNGGFVLHTC